MTYRLYVDEVGNDDITHVDDEALRYLSLSGVAIRHAHVLDVATPQLNKFRAEIFRGDPDHPVILHRKDIMKKKGAFGVLSEETLCSKFDDGLMAFLKATEFTLITILIDKKGMLNQFHWTQRHPYHYLMEILVEKYAQFLERKKAKGDIMPEKRRGKKDQALQAAYAAVRKTGTHFVPAQRIQAAIPSKVLKFREKRDNITGLQICDLVAYPSHAYVRTCIKHEVAMGPFSKRIIPVLVESKYDRSVYGQIPGYGMKALP